MSLPEFISTGQDDDRHKRIRKEFNGTACGVHAIKFDDDGQICGLYVEDDGNWYLKTTFHPHWLNSLRAVIAEAILSTLDKKE